MSTSERHRILIADDNRIFREAIAEWLRADGYDVVTADTGERAFLILRDWDRPIGWLYARAALPGLVDGWILADEYRRAHPMRAAIIASGEPRPTTLSSIVLNQPTPAAVLDSIRSMVNSGVGPWEASDDRSEEHRRAA